MPDLSYPANCINPSDRLEYAYRCQEVLRLIQNVFSRWLNTGLTPAQYANLPAKIRNKYSYISKLPKATWVQFFQEDFEPRIRKIGREIMKQKKLLKQSVRWSINVGDI
jgi:hypothetical protein